MHAFDNLLLTNKSSISAETGLARFAHKLQGWQCCLDSGLLGFALNIDGADSQQPKAQYSAVVAHHHAPRC